jgi:demethoxyubiquinone hydroxylase (CLK1/Coq7/Cat5 family)
MARRTTHQRLVRILRAAYSGELAAAYAAYRGHWKSLGDAAEREKVQQIEREEWAHRRQVGLMLDELGSAPTEFKEMALLAVGRTVGALCHVTGWFLPMYFAGWVESGNVREYEHAAEHARELGLADYEGQLREMAGVEREHEAFFLGVIAGHRLLPLVGRVFGWGVITRGEAPRNESA